MTTSPPVQSHALHTRISANVETLLGAQHLTIEDRDHGAGYARPSVVLFHHHMAHRIGAAARVLRFSHLPTIMRTPSASVRDGIHHCHRLALPASRRPYNHSRSLN